MTDLISRQTASGCEYWDSESNFCSLHRPSAERHEHITSEMDETFRIASEIRLAVGCNTARECWELARKGDIKRVRHGKWIEPEDPTCYKCSVCGEYATQEYGLTEPIFWRYCPNCGSRMIDEEE